MKIDPDKLALIKTAIAISTIALLILMPEDLIHLLAVIVHFIYESIAFAIEELLTHGLGFSKFQAQIIVFYSSLTIGMLLIYWLIRRLPQILTRIKTCLQRAFLKIRDYLLDSWQRFQVRWKLELLLAQVVSMASLLAWVLV
jgi:hypothetical protein